MLPPLRLAVDNLVAAIVAIQFVHQAGLNAVPAKLEPPQCFAVDGYAAAFHCGALPLKLCPVQCMRERFDRADKGGKKPRQGTCVILAILDNLLLSAPVNGGPRRMRFVMSSLWSVSSASRPKYWSARERL